MYGTSRRPYMLHAPSISFFSISDIRLKRVNVGLSYNSLFFSSTLFTAHYISMRFVVLTAAFQRIQVVCVDAVLLCEWFPAFRTWVLRAFGTSETTHQTTQRIIPENRNPQFTASLQVNVS
jgi:hypothetical protein